MCSSRLSRLGDHVSTAENVDAWEARPRLQDAWARSQEGFGYVLWIATGYANQEVLTEAFVHNWVDNLEAEGPGCTEPVRHLLRSHCVLHKENGWAARMMAAGPNL